MGRKGVDDGEEVFDQFFGRGRFLSMVNQDLPTVDLNEPSDGFEPKACEPILVGKYKLSDKAFARLFQKGLIPLSLTVKAAANIFEYSVFRVFFLKGFNLENQVRSLIFSGNSGVDIVNAFFIREHRFHFVVVFSGSRPDKFYFFGLSPAG